MISAIWSYDIQQKCVDCINLIENDSPKFSLATATLFSHDMQLMNEKRSLVTICLTTLILLFDILFFLGERETFLRISVNG